MRVLVFDPDPCTGCHICEETCSQTWFKEVTPSKSCIRITELEGRQGHFAARVTQLLECPATLQVAKRPAEQLYAEKLVRAQGIARPEPLADLAAMQLEGRFDELATIDVHLGIVAPRQE